MNENSDSNAGLIKVRVRLLGSARASGFESESLWAEPLGGVRYRIWNVPVFAYNLDMRDIVECKPDPEGGLPIVSRVVEKGDCHTIRVYFDRRASDSQIQAVLDLLGQRRALFEKNSREVWAVGLRTTEDYDWVGPALQPFVTEGVLRFESSFQPDEPQISETA